MRIRLEIFNLVLVWVVGYNVGMSGREIVKERDSKGRFITLPKGAAPPITSDTARDMVRKREEKRIRLYNEGAKRAVLDPQLIREYGDDAHIVERGMTLQTIASTPDAGKAAVMAAQHLDKAQGLIADKVQADAPAVALTITGDGLQRLAGLLGVGQSLDIMSVIPSEVIDAETSDTHSDEVGAGGGGE